jgi:hypothetical protein
VRPRSLATIHAVSPDDKDPQAAASPRPKRELMLTASCEPLRIETSWKICAITVQIEVSFEVGIAGCSG